MGSSSVVGGGAKSASRPRAAHVWGVEYDSASGSSRPPVLCDPSSRPHLVVGVVTLETITVNVEKKTIEDRQTDGQIDRQLVVETARDSPWTLRKQEWTDRRAVVGG